MTCQASFVQAAQQLAQYAVDMTPAGNVTIPPRDALDVTFFFRYRLRIALNAGQAVYACQ